MLPLVETNESRYLSPLKKYIRNLPVCLISLKEAGGSKKEGSNPNDGSIYPYFGSIACACIDLDY